MRNANRAPIFYANFHQVVTDDWTTQRIALAGDAAHAMSPRLGQGATVGLLGRRRTVRPPDAGWSCRSPPHSRSTPATRQPVARQIQQASRIANL
ncbi:FAD-dependent oxidoreductase [Kribbella sp.]|uniref:FAD-dependent oxidoreductase n=1 Tax=Kribbella sp. TaxID=1871183 RepID=UPI0039C8E676